MGETTVISARTYVARLPDSAFISAQVFIAGILSGDLVSVFNRYLLMFLSLFPVTYGIYLANSYYDAAGSRQVKENQLEITAITQSCSDQ